jgi:hypothetical protein
MQIQKIYQRLYGYLKYIHKVMTKITIHISKPFISPRVEYYSNISPNDDEGHAHIKCRHLIQQL